MGNWHRSPHVISVGKLLLRSKRSFLLDYQLPTELLKYLPTSSRLLLAIDPAGGLSREEIMKACQMSNEIIVTQDAELGRLVAEKAAAAWGVLLLATSISAQKDRLRQLSAGKLVLRPAESRLAMTAYVQHNRLLVDLRDADAPTISVFSNCRWLADTDNRRNGTSCTH